MDNKGGSDQDRLAKSVSIVTGPGDYQAMPSGSHRYRAIFLQAVGD
jgi:hypothetical protein